MASNASVANKVLVVPQSLVAELIDSCLFARRDFSMVTSETGEEALKVAGDFKPDLILFGSQLGDMPVARFCQSVRNHPDLGKTRLLFLADHVGEEFDDCGDAEPDGLLVSPVDAGELFKTIAGLLSVRLRDADRVVVDAIAQVDVLAHNPENDGKMMVSIVSLSDTGLRLEAPERIEVGSVVRLQFFLPGLPERMTLFGFVRVMCHELMLHYGIEFFAVKSAERKLLKSFLDMQAMASKGFDSLEGFST